MKVAFVSNGKGISGILSYSSNLKKAISERIEIEEVDVSRNIPKIVSVLGRIMPFDAKSVFSNHPLSLPKIKSDIVHFTSQTLSMPLLFRRYKSIVTVHDIALFEFRRKELFAGKRLSFFRKVFLKLNLMALRKADRIIADSEFTKRRVVEILGYPAEKIDVVYLGVDMKAYSPSPAKKEPYMVLYVGSEMPRKNLSVLIKAFAKLKKKIPESRLLKIGEPQWPNSRAKLKKMASELGVSDSVEFIDNVKDLASYYRKATVLVHPSIYEGFGFPVLEAMACGCPVISSDKTSLPEVGGDAALYFDGHDIENLADEIYRVMTDSKLRQKMVKNGFRQAKKFSWKKCADDTIEVYEKIK